MVPSKIKLEEQDYNLHVSIVESVSCVRAFIILMY